MKKEILQSLLAADVWEQEMMIDRSEKLVLFTWSPDPSYLPDCDFDTQHTYICTWIISFLKQMRCGAACVEANESAQPHYHGWYQRTDEYQANKMANVYIKAFKKRGNWKTTTGKIYRRNGWTDTRNCLFYYKKDLLGPSRELTCPIMTPFTQEPYTEPLPVMWFQLAGRKTVLQREAMESEYRRIVKFYTNSRI